MKSWVPLRLQKSASLALGPVGMVLVLGLGRVGSVGASWGQGAPGGRGGAGGDLCAAADFSGPCPWPSTGRRGSREEWKSPQLGLGKGRKAS